MDSGVWDQEYWLPATKHEKEFEKKLIELRKYSTQKVKNCKLTAISFVFTLPQNRGSLNKV